MSSGASVEINRLTKSYGSARVVDGVSMSVSAGEFVTLLGSSGSGKTTTLMAIAGFVMPDSGDIRIDGRDIARLLPEKRGLGVVFQSYALFPHYDVFENVAFPLRLRKTHAADLKRRVNEALELVGLGAFGKRRISQLSGGQQQRVALARALVFSPPVLLMDEPLGALDRKLREQLQSEIKRIQRDLGVTVIYVTHDQEEALSMSDRIAIMSDGRIAQIDTPDLVYEQPATPFVASFLGESNFIDVASVGHVDGFGVVRTTGDNPLSLSGRWAAGGATKDGDAMAMIRPESFMIDGDASDAGNQAPATILQREYLGSSIRLLVEGPLGKTNLRLNARDRAEVPAVGAKVNLTWRSEDTILFSRSTAEKRNW
jgi:spermidine/putrescine ABC transporter ATP-binding subunit